MTVEVLDLNQLVGNYAFEAALVGIVGSVRPVHCEVPATTGRELELVNGVREARGSPPSGNASGIAHCSKDLRGFSRDDLLPRVGATFD